MKKELFEKNPILKLTFDFGTSIGANAMEAQNAESRADFIHKMKIAAKEAEESQYWLWFCQYSKSYPDCSLHQAKLEEVKNKVLGKILSTSKIKSPVTG